MTNSHRDMDYGYPALIRAKRGTLASLHYSPPRPVTTKCPFLLDNPLPVPPSGHPGLSSNC